MKLIGQNAKYYSILVEPRLKEDMEAFKKAQIFLDTEYLLPMRIALISPDNKSSKDFRVEHIYPNANAVKDALFQGGALKRVETDPESQRTGAAAWEHRRCGWPARRATRTGPAVTAMKRPGCRALAVVADAEAVGPGPGGNPARPGRVRGV